MQTATLNTKLAKGMAAGCDGAHVRGLLASNAASARSARQEKAEDLAVSATEVRVTTGFMNFYLGGLLVGFVDRETIIPTGSRPVPSASFLPGLPATAFERAARRRAQAHAAARLAGEGR